MASESSIETTTIKYDDIDSQAFVAWPESTTAACPAVLVGHAWAGRNRSAMDSALALAERGMIGIAIDVYGEARLGSDPDECAALMQPLLDDRGELGRRLLEAFEMATRVRAVDVDRIGMMGYCFGGLCALDLARCCPQLKAAVSFHGLLEPPSAINFETFKAAVLVLHGHDDPLVHESHVHDLYRELSAADVDWQFHHFGGVVHGFTNPAAEDFQAGIVYNAKAAARAWRLAMGFFDEML